MKHNEIAGILKAVTVFFLFLFFTTFAKAKAPNIMDIPPTEMSIKDSFEGAKRVIDIASATPPPLEIYAEVKTEEVRRGEAFLVDIAARGASDFKISWQGKTVSLPAFNGYLTVMLPADYDSKGDFELKISSDGFPDYTASVAVRDKEYPKTNLQVAAKFVSPNKEDSKRIKDEQILSNNAMSAVSTERLWSLPFALPLSAPLSSPFGQARVFNGQLKSRHSGMDFDAKDGVPVSAIEAGRVILAGYFYYMGRFVFIDHGYGVISIYMHMSELAATEGDMVSRGDIIGYVGSTGRSTGPHLHLSISVLGSMVDPLPLLAVE